MYTCCPECETTFRVSAEDLRRAQGKVRCGDCEHVFNAVQYLMEEAPAKDDQPPFLSRVEEGISSANNPHREDSFLEPANETGISEAPAFVTQDDGYELEIKAYDEKTGEAWSPLDVSSWETTADNEPEEDSDSDAPVSFAVTETSAGPESADEFPDLETTAAEGEDIPTWLHDSSSEIESEQAFHAEADTHTGLENFGTDAEAEDTDAEVVEIDISDAVDLIEPEAETDDPDAEDDESIFGMPQTIEMAPAPDTEGLPTVEMQLADVAGINADSKDSPADEPDAADVEADQLYDDFTGIEEDALEDEALEDAALEDETEAATDFEEELPETEAEPANIIGELGLKAADFDDTIWESIPGVGAAEAELETPETDADEELRGGLSYTNTHLFGGDKDKDEEADSEFPFIEAGSFHEDVTDEDEQAPEIGQDEDDEFDSDLPVIDIGQFDDAAEATEEDPAADDEHLEDEAIETDAEPEVFEADADEAELAAADEETAEGDQEDNLDFNVPEDKWSTFFGTASKPPIFNKPAAVATEYEGGELDGAVDSNADLSAEPAPEVPAEAATNEPEAAEELAVEITEAFDEPAEGTEDSWYEMEPVEEVVMATGEFGATEISSSLKGDDADNSDGSKTHQEDDWKPNEWQPDAEEDQAAEWQPEYLDPKTRVDTPPRKGLWTGIILLLAIGFTVQLVHYNRDKLAASPAWGETVRDTYGKVGMQLYPTWSMDSYEIRGSEAVAGESGPDVLDIRTQIASVSDAPVGLPHIRVILRDRWSNPVAARNFAPTEYAKAGTLPANGLMQPNQTLGAHVSIVDPGSGAQGFELEICVPRRDTGMDCTGQPFK